MGNLRITVNCIRCKEEVDKNQTLMTRTSANEPRYECYRCYKNGKSAPTGGKGEMKQKINMYCERCRYRFSSKNSTCPYCSKNDKITSANVTIQDLL